MCKFQVVLLNLTIINRDHKLGVGVGFYQKVSFEYKNLFSIDLTDFLSIYRFLSLEIEGKNKNKNFLVGMIYQPSPENK